MSIANIRVIQWRTIQRKKAFIMRIHHQLQSISLVIAIMFMAANSAPCAEPASQPATQATTQSADSETPFDAILEKARNLSGKELQVALLSIASRFDTVDVCTAPGRNTWSFRTLNQRGKGIDAIRFTVPQGKNTRLYWAFACPNLTEWYILPLQGELKGFEKFYDVANAKYDVPAIVNRNLILQDLPTRLEPGGEYLLWFKIKGQRPVMLACSLVLLDDDAKAQGSTIASAIGLKDQSK
jgi:hypothetical protein